MWIVPCSFTLFRLLLVGWAAAILIIPGMWPLTHPVRFAVAILIIAALTDAVDGYFARKLKAATTWGGYFDHVVDLSLTGLLMYQGFMMLNSDIMKIFTVFQVLTMTIGGYQFLIKRQDCWPNLCGKLSYGIFIFGICVGMFMTGTSEQAAGLQSANTIVVMSIILRALAFCEYWIYMEGMDFFWVGEADQEIAKQKQEIAKQAEIARQKEEEKRPV